MELGTIVKWYKAPGDYVHAGEILLDVETEKAIISVEAPVSGILLFAENTPEKEIPVNGLIAIFGKPEEKSSYHPAAHSANPEWAKDKTFAKKNVLKTIGTSEKDGESEIEWILLPHLGKTSMEGTLVSWLVNPGDVLEVGTPIADVETGKAIIRMESYRDGEIIALNANPGDLIKYGDRLIGLKALKT